MPVKSKLCGHCGNDDPVQFRQYRNADEELIGKYCKQCQVEWLTAEYLAQSSNNDVPDSPTVGTDEDLMHQNIPIKPEVNKAFQVQSARTKIDTRYFAEILKPGDHVTWHRPKGIWHHSIVSEVNGDKNEIVVIHWNKKESQLQIFEEPLKMNTSQEESLFNQMYRIDYTDEINKANAQELVLARARSRVGDTGYGLLSDNCEAFATWCKTGYAKSHQVIWLIEKIKETCGLGNLKTVAKNGLRFISKAVEGIPLSAMEVIPAEVIEEALNGSQAVGAGIVILIETGFVIWDIGKAYGQRENGKISRRDFVEATVRRIFEGITSAGMAIGCSIGLEIGLGMLCGLAFGPVGAVVGGIIGGMIGGVAGGALGRAIGTWGGSFAGKVIAHRFPDDRAVMKVSDLKPGDHIVMNGWLFHPRCHAILADYKLKDKGKRDTIALKDAPAAIKDTPAATKDDTNNASDDDDVDAQILVIRNTHQNGIVKEWMKFEKPLFRVEYKKGDCLDPDQVLKNAESKIGQYRYNIATYNCKTFARRCKTIEGFAEQPL